MNKNELFEKNIGLEIHTELLTETKMYCSCKNTYGEKENTVTCPICTGYAGTLPFINKRAVDLSIKAGLAFNCKINRKFKMARKNYFYPDLPKGYQISQSYLPICENGYIDINNKRYSISNIHLEEDAGKVFEGGVDYNRCGIPLIEIVTEPCFNSSDEVLSFLKELRLILLHLGISDCKIEQGSMRCDVNISLHKKGERLGERTELKNVSGFSNIKQGIEYEIKRQTELLKSGITISQETRRWDYKEGKSILLRNKENAADYRYFNEPDIPYIILSDEHICSISSNMPILPRDKLALYINSGVSKQMAEDILNNIEKDRLFSECIKQNSCSPKTIAVLINGLISNFLNENPDFYKIASIDELKKTICRLGSLRENNVISSSSVKILFDSWLDCRKDIDILIKELNLEQASDIDSVNTLIKKVLTENKSSIEDYKKGKTNVLAYLVGQCMKCSGGKTDPSLCKKIILRELEKK